MWILVVTAIVLVPIAELWVILRVGGEIGILPTIASLVIISAVGTALVKREGIKVWRDLTGAISRGEEPSRQIVHGACLAVAGILLLSPGFVTDVVGIALMLPPVRSLVVVAVSRRVRSGITVVNSTRSGPIVGRWPVGRGHEVIDVDTFMGDTVEGEATRERDDETGTTRS